MEVMNNSLVIVLLMKALEWYTNTEQGCLRTWDIVLQNSSLAVNIQANDPQDGLPHQDTAHDRQKSRIAHVSSTL